MQLRQLAYYVEIIQCRSMSQAARKLYISQPSLSQTIQSMEEELGFPLLIRTSQGVLPTERGKRVYSDVRKLVENYNQMVDAWKSDFERDQTLNGTVRVVTVPTAYPMVAEHSVPAMQSTCPNLKCLVMEARRYEILQYLVQRKADLGVANVVSYERADFMETARAKGLCVLPLMEDTFQIAISSRHPLARQTTVTVNDLKRLPLILYSGQDAVGTPYYAKYFDAENTLYVNSNEKMIRMVANNQGAAVFPSHLTRYCQNPELRAQVCFLDVPEVCLPITHYMAYRSDEPLSPEMVRVKENVCAVYDDLKEST